MDKALMEGIIKLNIPQPYGHISVESSIPFKNV